MPLDQREDTDPTHPLPPGGRIYRTHRSRCPACAQKASTSSRSCVSGPCAELPALPGGR